jgi:hypothetical protein
MKINAYYIRRKKMKYTKYPELKKELKFLAKKIKELKIKRDNFRDFAHEVKEPRWAQSIFMWRAQEEAREFRHKHIAYCLLRGRRYEEIERPREGNEPDMIYVQMVMDEYEQPKTKFRTVQH